MGESSEAEATNVCSIRYSEASCDVPRPRPFVYKVLLLRSFVKGVS